MSPCRFCGFRGPASRLTTEGMISTHGYAVRSASDSPAPFDFERRELGPHDVLIDIMFCGVCHTDIHFAKNDWGISTYPVVPGHEIVGQVARVGSAVTKFKVGDRAGVGVMVDTCRECEACLTGEEVYCTRGMVNTYGGKDKSGQPTFGGYANKIVVDERYTLRIPDALDPAAAAPLLCAGITTYSPLRHWGISPGMKVGIVGLGGLGHLALKFAHAFGATAVQFTTSASKVEDAKRLGASDVVLTKESGWEQKLAGSFDFVLDCVAAPHDITPYVSLLKRDRTYVTVGIPDSPLSIHAFHLAGGRRSIAGSGAGGIRETQEMLDFCAAHSIASDIEMTSFDRIASAWDRVVKNDVKYRFVLDCSSL